MPNYECHLKNDVFIDAFKSLKQFRIHTGEITVVFDITVANTYTNHDRSHLSSSLNRMVFNGEMAVTEEMQAVRTIVSFHSCSCRPFQSLPECFVCAIPLRVSNPVRSAAVWASEVRTCGLWLWFKRPFICSFALSDGGLHLTPPLVCVFVVKAILHFRIDSLSMTRPLRASLPFAISLATRCLSYRREVVMGSSMIVTCNKYHKIKKYIG